MTACQIKAPMGWLFFIPIAWRISLFRGNAARYEGSANHLKSRAGCQKSCEIFESLLILKSEILNSLYDIPYIFGYKPVNSASRVPIDS